jgi:hypothetical protein
VTPEYFYTQNPPPSSYHWVRIAAMGRWIRTAENERWMIAEYVAGQNWRVPGLSGVCRDGTDDLRLEEISTFCGSNPDFQINRPVNHGLAALADAPARFAVAILDGNGDLVSQRQIRQLFSAFCANLSDALNGQYTSFESGPADNTVLLELPL